MFDLDRHAGHAARCAALLLALLASPAVCAARSRWCRIVRRRTIGGRGTKIRQRSAGPLRRRHAGRDRATAGRVDLRGGEEAGAVSPGCCWSGLDWATAADGVGKLQTAGTEIRPSIAPRLLPMPKGWESTAMWVLRATCWLTCGRPSAAPRFWSSRGGSTGGPLLAGTSIFPPPASSSDTAWSRSAAPRESMPSSQSASPAFSVHFRHE